MIRLLPMCVNLRGAAVRVSVAVRRLPGGCRIHEAYLVSFESVDEFEAAGVA